MLTVPDAFDSVNWVPGVLLLMVTRLPAVPAKPKFDTVVVVLAGNVTVAGCALSVMLLNVFAPVIINVDAAPKFKL